MSEWIPFLHCAWLVLQTSVCVEVFYWVPAKWHRVSQGSKLLRYLVWLFIVLPPKWERTILAAKSSYIGISGSRHYPLQIGKYTLLFNTSKGIGRKLIVCMFTVNHPTQCDVHYTFQRSIFDEGKCRLINLICWVWLPEVKKQDRQGSFTNWSFLL